MNIIVTILELFLLISVVVVAIQKPELSVNYWKEIGKASVNAVKWCIVKVQNMVGKDKVETNGGSNG